MYDRTLRFMSVVARGSAGSEMETVLAVIVYDGDGDGGDEDDDEMMR